MDIKAWGLLWLGAVLGASLRYLLGLWLNAYLSIFTLGVWVVNVLGCLMAGFITALVWQGQVADGIKLFYLTGFLGSFTTFSAFGVDVLTALHAQNYLLAVFIALLHVVCAVLACMVGFWFGGWVDPIQ